MHLDVEVWHSTRECVHEVSNLGLEPGDPNLEKSSLLGFAGYKVTNLNVLSVDDREKTPNYGKNIMNSSTLIATPPLKIIGIRAYAETTYGKSVIFDAFAKDSDKYLSKGIV